MSRGPKAHSNTATSSLPQPPSDLTEGERLLWDDVIPSLAAAVALSPVDSLALGDMIRCMARLGEAERLIDERGPIVDGHRGVKVRDPACANRQAVPRVAAVVQQAIGLDLKSRLRLPKFVGTESPLEAARERLQRQAASSSEAHGLRHDQHVRGRGLALRPTFGSVGAI